ncbi:MAG: M42 family metallopeptidase [Candidatus Micrarchaeota archaeon]
MRCSTMDSLMEKLSNAFGPTGFEGDVSKLMESELKKSCSKVAIDRMGDVIGTMGKAGRPDVMLGAHMDEVGLMVKTITEKGFLRFIKVGGIDDRTLPNQRVFVRTESGKMIPGVIGSKPPHMLKDEDMKKPIEYRQMFIDIGAKDKKDALSMGVQIGSPVGFNVSFTKLGNGLFTGKALDNRIGCYVMLEVAKKVKGEFAFAGTVQEEVSTFGKGAMVSAFTYYPKHFIAVDTAVAADHPECTEDEALIRLGDGPCISIVEAAGRGNFSDKKMIDWLVKTVKKEHIPYQLEVVEGGSTDAARVFNVREGIPSIAVCVPTRYIHSGVGVASERDVEGAIKLLAAALKSM